MIAKADLDPARNRLVAALKRVATGDRAALRLVYDMTAAKLFGVCLRIAGDRDAAEDILQDVYLKVWQRAGRFDPDRASPVTWLCTIARNTAIDWRRARPVAAAEAVLPAEAAAELPDERPAAPDQIAAAQEEARIAACLAALQPHQGQAIRSAFFDGYSYPQLAQAMAVPLGTMKSWVRRGLIQLKACLGDG